MNENQSGYPAGIYKLNLSIGLLSEREEEVSIPDYTGLSDDEWNALSDDEIYDCLHEVWKEWAWNYIDGGSTLQDSWAR